MIDMKRMPEQKPAEGNHTMLGGGPEHGEEEKPKYPWGLELRLESEELGKLGITEANLPQVGTLMKLGAYARVTQVRVEQMQGEENEVCVSLQIEQMELGAEGGSIAERMYGKP